MDDLSKISVNIDWEDFLGRQDLIWDVLPDSWHEGGFLGNGLLGVMVYKAIEDKNVLCFEINRGDLL